MELITTLALGCTGVVKGESFREFQHILNEDASEVISSNYFTNRTFEYVAQHSPQHCEGLMASEARDMHRQEIRRRIYFMPRLQVVYIVGRIF